MSCQSNGEPLLDWKLGMDPPSSLLHCSFCSLLHPSLCFLRHWVPGSLQCDKSWMALDSLAGLLSQKDLRELAREELNYSPPWRRDFVALTTPHTGLIEEPDVSVSVAIIFPCSIFLKEAWLNTSQPVLWVSGISRRAYCIWGICLSSISCTGNVLVPRATGTANSPPISLGQVEIPHRGALPIPMPSTGMIWITQYQQSYSS